MSITFSFGQNWYNYVQSVRDEDVRRAVEDIEYWIGKDFVRGKAVCDVGCGSGIHSLAFYWLGAAKIVSFDLDEQSVHAANLLRAKYGSPAGWTILQGSILDAEFLSSLQTKFDIVYAWGSLHHTGAMYNALRNTMNLVTSGGILWVSLYAAGPRYEKDLRLKQRYNRASAFWKAVMIWSRVARMMLVRLKDGKNPFTWNERKGRGMTVYHDLVDWLGGLPYEVADEDEVVKTTRREGFVLERVKFRGEGRCNIYVFSRPISTQDSHPI